jgi:hypothetical protein
MKLSTINWLSRAIALPLFITAINISTSAGAEQIDRSRSRLDSLPVLKNLTLSVPVVAPELSVEDSDKSSPFAPIWSNFDRQNSSKTSIGKPANKVRNTSKSKKLISSTDRSVTALSLTSRQSNKTESISKRQKLLATNNIEAAPVTTAVSKLKTVVKSGGGDNRQLKPVFKQRIAARSRSPFGDNYLRLVRDPNRKTNDMGNPIYILKAYVNGQRYRTFATVSGTATTQNVDRNRGNNFAPLPDGLYNVGVVMPGTLPEVGRTFISILPKFETGRVDLGIHLDRSFNKTNGYDGTAGCIGMTTAIDRDAINEFVTKYRPRNLVVDILSSDDR